MTLTNAEEAYVQIKDKIVTVEMPPGSVIREARLIEQLNLGRTPIREALKRLQAESLVEVVPRRGFFVTDITITDLRRLHEVRVEVDPLCVRLAAERLTSTHKEEFRSLIAEYQAMDKTDKRSLLDLDRRFHYLLADAADNKFLKYVVEKFYNLSVRIWYLSLPYFKPTECDLSAFIEILEAIEAGDAYRAGERMREHVDHFHRVIKMYF